MRYLRPFLHIPTLVVGLVAVPAILGLFARPAAGQASDPVEQLRLALQVPFDEDPLTWKYRDESLKKAADNLRTPSDLRRALALTEWKDRDALIPEIRAIDQKGRASIGQRLQKIVAEAVANGDANTRTAVAAFVGEIGASVRALDGKDPHGFGRSLAPAMI